MQDRFSIADKYIITLRIIQPARVQDIFRTYAELWEEKEDERLRDAIYSLHEKMKEEGFLIDVRRGTYLLTAKGMEIAAHFVKEREIDNRRLFLMKRQRRMYL